MNVPFLLKNIVCNSYKVHFILPQDEMKAATSNINVSVLNIFLETSKTISLSLEIQYLKNDKLFCSSTFTAIYQYNSLNDLAVKNDQNIYLLKENIAAHFCTHIYGFARGYIACRFTITGTYGILFLPQLNLQELVKTSNLQIHQKVKQSLKNKE